MEIEYSPCGPSLSALGPNAQGEASMAGKKKVKSSRLTVVNAECAGVDVGKSHHYVAVDPC